MNLINNVMNKHHCPTQDKGMSPKRKEDNKKAWTLHFVCLFQKYYYLCNSKSCLTA